MAELAVKAPGTFQHSLQVANIAEAVINKIGGNGLMIKVGAYFHDIGKMQSPQYFVETPARNYILPTVLIDFIKTLDGTTQVS